ncbi:MAG: hypothetical protein AABM67_06550 [Acidobacteriota bacterium]
MNKTLLILFLLFAFPARAQKDTGSRPPVAPEVNHTVDSINGTWLGKMTANVPGFPPETFDWTMNCTIVARGAGVSCTNTGKASIGSMAESCLLAYDQEGKAVHYMCVTSMGEVHDHKGKWKDARTIEFEPLRAGLMGQPIVETLRWHFPDVNTIAKTSDIKLANGSVMHFEFRGNRQ